jgi:hypothetical protein
MLEFGTKRNSRKSHNFKFPLKIHAWSKGQPRVGIGPKIPKMNVLYIRSRIDACGKPVACADSKRLDSCFRKHQAASKAGVRITWACRVNTYRACLLHLMLRYVHDAVGLFIMPSVHL